MENVKSPGNDGVMSEIIKAPGDYSLNVVSKLANEIRDTGKIMKKLKDQSS